MQLTEIMRQLIQRSTGYFNELHQNDAARYVKLAGGRSPKAAVFACYDSINPDPFQLGIGEIGWHRNAGGIIGHWAHKGHVDGAAATVELALSQPELEAIGVIGHQDCAFCKAFLTRQYKPDQEHLKEWVELHGPAVRELMLSIYGTPPEPSDMDNWNTYLWRTVREHTIRQYFNLLSYPAVVRRIEEGTLTAFAGVLQLTPSPQLLWFDPMTGRFKPAPYRGAITTVGFGEAAD
jgi:carbonic anhydrase